MAKKSSIVKNIRRQKIVDKFPDAELIDVKIKDDEQ